MSSFFYSFHCNVYLKTQNNDRRGVFEIYTLGITATFHGRQSGNFPEQNLSLYIFIFVLSNVTQESLVCSLLDLYTVPIIIFSLDILR